MLLEELFSRRQWIGTLPDEGADVAELDCEIGRLQECRRMLIWWRGLWITNYGYREFDPSSMGETSPVIYMMIGSIGSQDQAEVYCYINFTS